MIESILKILESALGIWEAKEKTKYADSLKDLKTQFYAEMAKDPSHRSNAVLDDLSLRIRILCETIAAAIGTKNP